MRERKDDLPLLVQHYLRRFSRDLGREVRDVAPEALERLLSHPWPGNIRELQSVLKQALLQASGEVLLPAFLPESLDGPCEPASLSRVHAPVVEAFVRERLGASAGELYAETHRWLDGVLLPFVLEQAQGNQRQASVVLGIARQTLRLKLRELGLTAPPARDQDEDEVG